MTCDWPVNRECLPAAEGDAALAARDAAEDMAVEVLFNLSGRQFGVCPVIARPCVTQCMSYDTSIPITGLGWFPIFELGKWRNVSCGCTGSCTRSGESVIHLAGPVGEVTAVTVGGVVMDPSQYRVEGDYLIRVGGAAWPDQDLLRPLDEPGTWSVEYTKGRPVPPGVGVLVGMLAAEFFAACVGGKCKLPRRTRSVSRNGVQIDMIDPTDIYAEGLTGIPQIDLWLSSVNPNKLMRRSRVR